MEKNCCHAFLAFHLKFLNFLQFFIGISVVIYSAFLLNQWQSFAPVSPPPAIAPPPNSLFSVRLSMGRGMEVADRPTNRLYHAGEMVSGFDELGGYAFGHLPAPWFIYVLMGVGVIQCCISCTGYIAAEVFSGCCLCFYTLLVVVVFLLEGAVVAFIALDHSWKRDLPSDPTGELDGIKSFIEKNVDICKWVGIALLIIQASSLLLALILRAMSTTRRSDSEIEDDFADVRGRIREPLLSLQQNHASGSVSGEAWGSVSDVWNSWMREKYGFRNENTRHNKPSQNPSATVNS